MTSLHKTPAFALFGSAARGDHDVYSDKDLLIVSDSPANLRTLKASFSHQGWSCTLYSWQRLQHAADQGSLFVQHLKQEAKILRDPSDRLAELLANFSPKASYKREANGAASLLGDLTDFLPRCDAGPMWTMDVMSVSFRSLAVATLADEGIYSFANSDIMNGLARIGLLHRQDGYELEVLRRYKSLYRNGVLDKHVGWKSTYELLALIDRIFRLGLSVRRVDTLANVEQALARQNSAEWYVKCRRIESVLWMLRPRQNQTDVDFVQKRNYLFKLVQSPNGYAWHFTGGHAATQKRLFDLATMCQV